MILNAKSKNMNRNTIHLHFEQITRQSGTVNNQSRPVSTDASAPADTDGGQNLNTANPPGIGTVPESSSANTRRTGRRSTYYFNNEWAENRHFGSQNDGAYSRRSRSFTTSNEDSGLFTVPADVSSRSRNASSNHRRNSLSDSETEIPSRRRHRRTGHGDRRPEHIGTDSDSSQTSAAATDGRRRSRQHGDRQHGDQKNLRAHPYYEPGESYRHPENRRVLNSQIFSQQLVANSTQVNAGIAGESHRINRHAVNSEVDNSSTFSEHRILNSDNVNSGVTGLHHNINL